MVTHFFVQDDNSKQLLASLNLNNVTISGDTRFDRVWDNAMQPKPLPVIAEFKGNNKVFVAGSTWPPDEKLIAPLINQYSDWKFIFAPHEIGSEKIKGLEEVLSGLEVIKFSEIVVGQTPLNKYQVLIIDNIGMLSSLYQYGEVAYIGGGFGAGIHNTLEAAAFGLPVIFGPKYEKFKEARDLVSLKAGFSINTPEELAKAAQLIMTDAEYHAFASEKIRQYVKDNTGATGKIISHIGAV
jgi:3-deoxy-D-manno-octulosonic-acid transferase